MLLELCHSGEGGKKNTESITRILYSHSQKDQLVKTKWKKQKQKQTVKNYAELQQKI